MKLDEIAIINLAERMKTKYEEPTLCPFVMRAKACYFYASDTSAFVVSCCLLLYSLRVTLAACITL
ncbi:MAG: hypothetical protein P4M11_04320 [Candidatus Pacebacteria bacterium]|nr:hypothetical protein [Candidatus Paceibacterota bacterium]